MVVRERKAPRETHVMLGGDFTRKGAAVTPGVPGGAAREAASGEPRSTWRAGSSIPRTR